jgi:mannose-6-phosphate isomerase-like protein (cupin superfamily)
MSDRSISPPEAPASIPPDDPSRKLTVANPDDPRVGHVFVAGDTYTILVSGAETGGRFCLIDMLVPDGGGPPPHRHDFEEMFSLLDGELEFIFRGETQTVKAPATVAIPSNAPHQFRNKSGKTVHMLCMCAPAGLDAMFLEAGVPVESRSSPPPKPDGAPPEEKLKTMQALARKYRTEILAHA